MVLACSHSIHRHWSVEEDWCSLWKIYEMSIVSYIFIFARPVALCVGGDSVKLPWEEQCLFYAYREESDTPWTTPL